MNIVVIKSDIDNAKPRLSLRRRPLRNPLLCGGVLGRKPELSMRIGYESARLAKDANPDLFGIHFRYLFFQISVLGISTKFLKREDVCRDDRRGLVLGCFFGRDPEKTTPERVLRRVGLRNCTFNVYLMSCRNFTFPRILNH